MTTGLPSQTQVIELLAGEFARAGYEIEDVVIDSRIRPPRITVIADGDTALDLDTVATLSRTASDLLDTLDGNDGNDGSSAAYVLEVSSPGVERPLTTEKHFRRARGRKVDLALSDGSQLAGRVARAAGGTLSLVVRAGREPALREIPLADIIKAVVQVEFSPPPHAELELLDRAEGTEAGA
ncbi:ribosome maturation factor RimP [Mycobacterium camsae]|uniref:ribosome maturation factor RimP n=1 Tax=Mycobacterium gordonae TaxID=1778 RepID=UPI00197DE725|nr:ribosome maturation factor RimP [Mycobacterium gordonae]